MPEGPVVCDAGPLVALAKLGRLEIFRELYGRVLVPEAVFREVSEAGAGRAAASELDTAAWVDRVVGAAPEPLLASELGPGEAAVIAVARQQGARLVILDERKARRIAERAYGLRVKGSAGVLVAAKRAGLLETVRPLLRALVAVGYYVSDRVIEEACRQAGE
jgi:predicted nucleic acid-binding protein